MLSGRGEGVPCLWCVRGPSSGLLKDVQQEACAIPWLSVHRDRKSAKEESGSREGEGKEPSGSLSLLLLRLRMPGEDCAEVTCEGPGAEVNPQSLPGFVFSQESRKSLQPASWVLHT